MNNNKSMVKITYNPYLVTTKITINGAELDRAESPLVYVEDKRLQTWVEPKNSWKGIFKELKVSLGSDLLEISFEGTERDFKDLEYAKNTFGDCFNEISLIHINSDDAINIDPYYKLEELKKIYLKILDGPVEEFKTQDIRDNFENALNSDFKIVIIAPMSSGKSTLINAIVGKDLLPAINQATTAVITEIRDNDNFSEFILNANDKYGNVVACDEVATKQKISELNYKKDPNDKEGKEALINKIKIEGPIKTLDSTILNTVFIDTPGGNNSQNAEHEAMMNEAIYDENKSLILYVFNGTTIETNDSNTILTKIANAMKISMNGKQARDRFLFVANKMDAYDLDSESYEGVIENTIIPQLESQGVFEPNLFLTSAYTAKLVRMISNGEELSEKEDEDIETLLKRFTKNSRALHKYASISNIAKDQYMKNAQEFVEKANETDSKKEALKYRMQAAEINSGIPALEYAISEYLEKYAVALKIKDVRESFMKKVEERDMINKCRQEWVSSKEKFDEIKTQIVEKKKILKENNRLLTFRTVLDDVKLDLSLVRKVQAVFIEDLIKISSELSEDESNKELDIEEAEKILTGFEEICKKLSVDINKNLEMSFEISVKNTCNDVLKKYKEYLVGLEAEGLFDIGNFNIKTTVEFDQFGISSINEYLVECEVSDGYNYSEKSGFGNAVMRFFGFDSGWNKTEKFKKVTKVNMSSLIKEELTELQNIFDAEVEKSTKVVNVQVDKIKENTFKKIDQLEKLVEKMVSELDAMFIDKKQLHEEVRKNQSKADWTDSIVKQVESLLDM